MPAYRVRVSKRARRVLLRVVPGHGLEIVIPVGFDSRNLPTILLKHQDWIANQLNRCETAIGAETAGFPLPESIELRAEGISVAVSYHPSSDAALRLSECGREHIKVVGNLTDQLSCIRLLQNWLKHRARPHLVSRLDEVSAQTGLRYRTIQIRGQKSRWGSCSARGTISLNCKLMFIPPEPVRYLLIHELCHTTHLNHSSRFWDLVQRHEPDFKNLDVRLRKARDCVPLWADYP